jgi:PAS domain S-box-containing protein
METVDSAQQMVERMEEFMTHLHGIAFIKDPGGRYVYVSDAAAALWDMEPEAMVSRTDEEIWPPELARVYRKNDEAVLQHLKRFEGIEVIPRNGRQHSWLIYKFPIVERATQKVFVGGVGVDITGRSRSEEQLRGLAARLQATREQERALTAREVHDIGQVLAALDLHLSMIAGRLSEGGDPSAVKASLAAASELLSSTIATSAKICGDLRPSVLDNLGLADAIVWYAREFSSRTGIQVFAKSLDKMPVDPAVRVLVFRLYQDILANVERHAAATEVRISLGVEQDSLVLSVRDNGKGISSAQIADAASLGLVEMRELAHSFGGTITFAGTPGKGTRVSVEIPLDAQVSGVHTGGNPAA